MAKYVNTIGLDLRTVDPIRKMKCFLTGFLMMTSYVLILVYSKELFAIFKEYLGHDASTVIVGFIGMVGGAYILMFRGFLKISFCQVGGTPEYLNVKKYYGKGFIDNSSKNNYQGINRILDYVDSESSLSTREKASEMFISSRSIINSLNSSNERTLEYINAKLEFMTQENGFQFLKGKLR